MSAGEPLLSVRALAVRFTGPDGEVEAVRGVDLDLPGGHCLAVVGESGSGKSVTARALVGLTGRTAGVTAERLLLDGQDLLGLSQRQWRQVRGARIGFVPQDALSSLDPLRRVGEEVAEPLAVHTAAGRAARRARVTELLDGVGVPEPLVRARQYPHELSGGLRQRALIASAIAAGPPLLVADEPTTALDATVQAQILDLLAARRDSGAAVLLISHDLTVVGRLADRIAVMYAGVVVEEGPTDRLLTRPAHPYTQALLAAAPAPGEAGPGEAAARPPRPPLLPPAPPPACPYAPRCALADARCRTEPPPLAPWAGALSPHRAVPALSAPSLVRCWHPGRDLTAHPVAPGRDRAPGPSRPRRPADTPVVSAAGLVKRFRGPDRRWRDAVAGVSFDLPVASALGIVGESGSGKTTVAQLVMGLLEPDAGTVLLDGRPWSGVPEQERRPRRRRLQWVDQDPLGSFDPRFTVERIVAEALGGSGRRALAAHRPRVADLLTRVGLEPSLMRRRGAELSGGQRQRVAIARALGPDPEVIVCDEPVSALDVSVQAQILDLLAALRADLGVALLFISHDLGVVRQVCDRVLVMKDGAVVEEGDVAAVFDAPAHPYTRALLAAVAGATPAGATAGRPDKKVGPA
jgi:peptide/nickel transport system ATP-binding protein